MGLDDPGERMGGMRKYLCPISYNIESSYHVLIITYFSFYTGILDALLDVSGLDPPPGTGDPDALANGASGGGGAPIEAIGQIF